MESLAVDNGRVIFVQVDRCREIVILVSLVAFYGPEFDAVKLTFDDLLGKVLVITPRQNDVNVRAIGDREICQPQILPAIGGLIDRSSPARLVSLAFQSAGIKRGSVAAANGTGSSTF